jgi:hypothetical protein
MENGEWRMSFRSQLIEKIIVNCPRPNGVQPGGHSQLSISFHKFLPAHFIS